ncbi:MAG: DUF3261 domain-containing protein [Steroidobacteraceae bacterium]
MRRLILLCCGLAVNFAGCATMTARREFNALPLLPPAALGLETNRMQRLTIGRIGGESAITLDAVVEVDPDELRVAGILLGRRVLLLTWDGEHLTESRDPLVPASLNGRAVLRDLQLVYWPAEAIRARLPQGCRLEDSAAIRHVLCGSTLVLDVQRSDAQPLGAARLQNHLGHYMISIESAP